MKFEIDNENNLNDLVKLIYNKKLHKNKDIKKTISNIATEEEIRNKFRSEISVCEKCKNYLSYTITNGSMQLIYKYKSSTIIIDNIDNGALQCYHLGNEITNDKNEAYKNPYLIDKIESICIYRVSVSNLTTVYKTGHLITKHKYNDSEEYTMVLIDSNYNIISTDLSTRYTLNAIGNTGQSTVYVISSSQAMGKEQKMAIEMYLRSLQEML